MDEKKLKIFEKWFEECKYDLTVYRIRLTLPANPGMINFANALRTKKKIEFLRLWNNIGSMCRRTSPIQNLSLNLDLVQAEMAINEVGAEGWDWDWAFPEGEERKTDVFNRVWWSRQGRGRGKGHSRGQSGKTGNPAVSPPVRPPPVRPPPRLPPHAPSLPPPAQHPVQHAGIPI